MLNKIILIGRLTNTPELRYTPAGIAYLNFSLAVNRCYTNSSGNKDVDFIDIVVWRRQAENCAKYLTKGKLVAVEGSLQINTYEGKDGKKRKAAEVAAESVQFLTPKNQGENAAATGNIQDLPW